MWLCTYLLMYQRVLTELTFEVARKEKHQVSNIICCTFECRKTRKRKERNVDQLKNSKNSCINVWCLVSRANNHQQLRHFRFIFESECAKEMGNGKRWWISNYIDNCDKYRHKYASKSLNHANKIWFKLFDGVGFFSVAYL